MRQRAEELRREKGGNKKAKNLEALQELIDAMPEEDRALAAAVHVMVSEEAPHLDARTWYGMPAWENEDGVVVFLQVASKFGVRYSTLGFQDTAQLDDGSMWPRASRCFRLTTTPPATSAHSSDAPPRPRTSGQNLQLRTSGSGRRVLRG